MYMVTSLGSGKRQPCASCPTGVKRNRPLLPKGQEFGHRVRPRITAITLFDTLPESSVFRPAGDRSNCTDFASLMAAMRFSSSSPAARRSMTSWLVIAEADDDGGEVTGGGAGGA